MVLVIVYKGEKKMITVNVWLFGILIIVPFCLMGELFRMSDKLKKQKRAHEMEIYHLKARHSFALIGKNLDILDAKLKMLIAELRSIAGSFKYVEVLVTLMQFKLWWHAQGKYEFEIVRRKDYDGKQTEIPVMLLK
ncbi:MAG: hypothetical protein WCK60_01490 [Candidatus Nomurabacteria bacterium]